MKISDSDKKLLEQFRNKVESKPTWTADDFFNGVGGKYYANKNLRHYDSFFPNNYLDLDDIKENRDLYKEKLLAFYNVLEDPNTSERQLLNQINTTESHFIVASLLNDTIYGHHDRYIFPEFELPPSFKADYLIVGKNSFGYNFLFVELENPYGRITQKDGDLGEVYRKGLNQIEEWTTYLEKNFPILKTVFEKQLNPEKQLPDEFCQLDKTKIEFAVVAGRRNDFQPKTYRIRNKTWKNSGILIRHYDNLIDNAKNVIQNAKY
jgi:hypothetical protein